MNVLLFDDDPCRAKGEGITRTSNPRATLWPVEIHFQSCRPMRSTIKAVSKKQAKAFAEARHPNAVSIRLLGKKEAQQWAA